MISRSTKPLRRSPVRRKRKAPRRGRVQDRDFLEWMHEQHRCAVHGVGGCVTPFSVHHVRFCGSGRDDRRVLGLCYALHLHGWGENSIERLGKDAFEREHRVSIEAEIARYNEDYTNAVMKWQKDSTACGPQSTITEALAPQLSI